jgi:hypothetical protein
VKEYNIQNTAILRKAVVRGCLEVTLNILEVASLGPQCSKSEERPIIKAAAVIV